jgi:hypothetical protein
MTADIAVLTLRCARGAAAQQAALDAWLVAAPGAPCAVIAEGALWPLQAGSAEIVQLAACPCCLGAVPLRVALTRLLRQSRPRALLVLLASAEHLPRLRAQIEGGAFGAIRLDAPEPGATV